MILMISYEKHNSSKLHFIRKQVRYDAHSNLNSAVKQMFKLSEHLCRETRQSYALQSLLLETSSEKWNR